MIITLYKNIVNTYNKKSKRRKISCVFYIKVFEVLRNFLQKVSKRDPSAEP